MEDEVYVDIYIFNKVGQVLWKEEEVLIDDLADRIAEVFVQKFIELEQPGLHMMIHRSF